MAAHTSTDEAPKKPLIFKFEFSGQQYELKSLTHADTVGHLRAVVCSMLNIDDYDRIQLKTLQPTKIIDASDDTKPLSDVFRQSREKIVVEFVQNSSDFSSYAPEVASQSDTAPLIKHHKLDADSSQTTATKPSQTSCNKTETPLTSSMGQSSTNAPTPNVTDESLMRTRKTREQFEQLPVCSSTGYLLRHPVPSNNSCLFISVHFCLTNGIVDDQIGKSMRKIIAETVASDKEKYDDAFLGKSNNDYCNWILDDNNWGGAIELSILCKYYETEIVAIDIKNTILNRFGEDSHYPQRMLLIYDGLHYDPLKFQPVDENRPIQTTFPSDNIEVLSMAEELAKELKQSHQFTDLKSISMRCGTCDIVFDAKSVTDHVKQTGHTNFREVQ